MSPRPCCGSSATKPDLGERDRRRENAGGDPNRHSGSAAGRARDPCARRMARRPTRRFAPPSPKPGRDWERDRETGAGLRARSENPSRFRPALMGRGGKIPPRFRGGCRPKDGGWGSPPPSFRRAQHAPGTHARDGWRGAKDSPQRTHTSPPRSWVAACAAMTKVEPPPSRAPWPGLSRPSTRPPLLRRNRDRGASSLQVVFAWVAGSSPAMTVGACHDERAPTVIPGRRSGPGPVRQRAAL
jgi:hypothetical protein